MATLTKTPSGGWKAVVRRQGYPTVSKTWRTKRDAEDWARSVEDEMRRGAFVRRDPADRLTVSAALDRYLREVVPTKKTHTQKGNKSQAKRLKAYFGDYSVGALSPDVIAAYRDERLTGHRMARDTVRAELALLSHLYETAIKEWRIGLWANPVRAIRWPRPGDPRDRRITQNEEKRLLKACDAHSNPILGWMVRLTLSTAMRAGEIRRLRVHDVDLTRRIARLRDTKNHESRTVPLTKSAVKVLRDAIENPTRPDGETLIFFGEPGRDGVRRGYEYKPTWRLVRNKIGLSDLRFHDLRHEAISRLVEAGLGDQEVAAISGHRSMQMLKRYTHLRAENLVTRLDGIHMD